jgi:hypothetical protein
LASVSLKFLQRAKMIAVVGGITRNDQTQSWNRNAGCASGVGESEWHTD